MEKVIKKLRTGAYDHAVYYLTALILKDEIINPLKDTDRPTNNRYYDSIKAVKNIFGLKYIANIYESTVLEEAAKFFETHTTEEILTMYLEKYLDGIFVCESDRRIESEMAFRELFSIDETIPRIWKTACTTF
jgi:hypothetical protein